MFQLIPRPVHRALLRIAHTVRKMWWRRCRPVRYGCRVLAIDAQGRVLFVRHSYSSRYWAFPGGGIHRNESPVSAARRELFEETGCVLENARLVARTRESLHGATNHVAVVVGRTDSRPEADMREITEVRFFAPDALPPDIWWVQSAGLPGWLAAYTDQSRES